MNKVLASLLFFLILMEAGLRLSDPLIFGVTYKKGRKIEDPKKLTQPFPHEGFGYQLIPNMEVFFKNKKFNTNKKGFRVSPSQPPGEKRIVGLGDSVMMGWGVANKETYLHLIGEKLRAQGKSVRTFNLGVLGFNSVQEYFYFKEKGLDLKPDLLIIQYVGNDNEETNNKKGVLPWNSSSYTLNLIQFLIAKTFGKLEPSRNYDWRPVKMIDSTDKETLQDSVVWAYMQLFQLLQKNKIPTILVLDSRYISWGAKHSDLEALAAQFQIPTINLFKKYRSLEESISIEEAVSIEDDHNLTMVLERGVGKDNHPNALWHKKTAELLAPTVFSKLFP